MQSLLDAPFRRHFVIPSNSDVGASLVKSEEPCTYLCGNSLGLLPKSAEALVQEEFRHVLTAIFHVLRAVQGHHDHPHGREWMNITNHVNPLLAELLGAREAEVACMGTLTANLHLMMNTFYKPTPERYKLLCEAKAFPSDQYAFASQVQLHGFNPEDSIIEMFPRQGEFYLREEDILEVIEEQGSSIALVIFSGVQYYTGQWFPMQSITKAAKAQGCICGWDLAHAIGNVPLSLHDWDVDWAVWCSYKYLNSGPGGIAGLFVHEKWNHEKPRYAGWWGHDPATRFLMPPTFSPIQGAQGLQMSNPSILAVASLLGSLQVFKEAGMMERLRVRSVELTAHLERLLGRSAYFVPPDEAAIRLPLCTSSVEAGQYHRPAFTVITPSAAGSRGSQLSLLFFSSDAELMMKVHDGLRKYGVITDDRRPNVIRLAPMALYNTVQDCESAAKYLDEVLKALDK
ncbi:kynureninase [Multifurca ochricompacta]|uniref:Kynureninase n=1 Tax=Multifurca ochricompacta TaxID=376703 RepID=A0AAD4QQD2_9AGAM|nr:kynureninase [Multifurca ochricompacta]